MKKWKTAFQRNKLKFIISTITMALITVISIYFFYAIYKLDGIETFLRILLLIVVIIIWVLFFLFSIKYVLKKKKWKYILFTTIKIIYMIILIFITYNINQIYSKINNMAGSYTIYSSSIITNDNNPVDNIKDLSSDKIGLLNDESSIDGYQIPKEIIEVEKINNEIIFFDSYTDLLKALNEEEIKYIFLPTNYKIMFQEIDDLENLIDDTKIILTREKKVYREVIVRNKNLNDPFTILLMGVDSEKENISSSSFNGDALMLITFNPKTLNSTMVSIPRDTYVPISCFNGQRKNKITHAAWYGEECMKNTIENFMDIEIDYTLKINFKGLVKLVDAIGGIEVDVPYTFCEQNSNRKWGKNTIYLKKGYKNLTGEEALALSRNRKNNSHICGSAWGGNNVSDFTRGQNQQIVIKGIINKAKNIRSIDKLYEIIDTISNNIETNMTTSEILSFYNIGKDILTKYKDETVEDILNFQRLHISGYDKYIVDYSQKNNHGTKSKLYNFVPYKGSILDVVNAMKNNLSGDIRVVKTFAFNINEPFKEYIIGKGYYNEESLPLLPSFIGADESEVVTYAKKRNIQLIINYITSTDGNHKKGQVINQTPYTDMDLDYVNKITVDVVKEIVIAQPDNVEVNCSLEENKESDNCLMPNFVGKNYSEYLNWKKSTKLSFLDDITEIKLGNPMYDVNKIGQIISQNYPVGASLYDLIEKTLKIEYISNEQIENEVNPEE